MATKFGKELRRIRLDNNEILADMSKKLNISISYLSAIEAGEREIPKDMVENLKKSYHLNDEKAKFLELLMIEQAKNITIPLGLLGTSKKELVFTLSRRLNDMSDAECARIVKLLEEENSDKG